MPKTKFALSGYRAMWLFAMFDLPTWMNQCCVRSTRNSGKSLLKHGFTMLQYSVYVHYVRSEETEAVYRKRVSDALPTHGQVRLVSITDRQFEKMEVFVGKKREKVEDPPHQLMLF